MEKVETDKARIKIAILKAIIEIVFPYRHSIAMTSLMDRRFRSQIALPADQRYGKDMAKAGRIDFNEPNPNNEEEDEEALAAIDEGIRDAEAGRTVPIEEVRRLLPSWITASSSRKKR
jgi:hypothetical protein